LAFRGHYEHSLDAKDRLTVPARFRGQLADGVVLSAGLDPCVEVFPTQGYDNYTQKFLGDLNPLSRQGRMMRRRIHGDSYDEKLDSAGRVRLSRHLIEHAGLEGPCIVIGVDDHLEVWNAETWAKEEEATRAAAAEVAEEIASTQSRSN
jgi:MraZ protein